MKKIISVILGALLLFGAVCANAVESGEKIVAHYDFEGQMTDAMRNTSVNINFDDYDGEESRAPMNSGGFYAKGDDGDGYWQWDSSVLSGGGFNMKIRGVLTDTEVYTIAMTFSVDSTGTTGNRYRKILHFGEYDDDNGFYFLSGGMTVYYGGNHSVSEQKFEPNQKISLIVTRDKDNVFSAYVHNSTGYKKVYSYEDKNDCTEIQNGHLGFFYDDNKGIAGEAVSSGRLYDLKIYDEAMSETDICGDLTKVTFGGHTYQVFCEELTPPEAEKRCIELGGHLVTLTTPEERDFVNELADNNDITDYIIGATDRDTEGIWTWMTGEKWEFTDWSTSSEPNDGLGRGEDYCLSSAGRNRQWVDVYGGYDNYTAKAAYICEWDSYKTTYNSSVSQWSTPEMEEAYKEGLIPERLVGEDLTKPVSRAEFSAIAVELYEALSGKNTEVAKTPFTDIANDPDKEYIQKAYGLNVVVGISDTEFAPTAGVTREQLATMLCRTIKKYKFADWTYATDSQYYLDSEGVKKFADDKDISDYAKPSVYYMVKMGIINGMDETHFAPKNTTTEQEATGYASATREQAIALSLRTYKLSEMWK